MIDARDPFNVRFVDPAHADQIKDDIDHILARSDGAVQIDAAVAAEMRARYPNMPEHLARGLGATYAAALAARRSEAVGMIGTRSWTPPTDCRTTPSLQVSLRMNAQTKDLCAGA